MLIFSYCITWIETTLQELLICQIVRAGSRVKETETMGLAEEVCKTNINHSISIKTLMEFPSQPIDSCLRFLLLEGPEVLVASRCNVRPRK